MNTKTIITNDKVFETILSASSKLVDFVRPTYGPASNKVAITKLTHAAVIDDGVQIARDFTLDDPVENSVMKIMREVAIRTNDRVGDGTTGSLILADAILHGVSALHGWSGRAIELELKEAKEEAIKKLKKMARLIKTEEDLRKVARISFDNPEIADLLAKTYKKIGPDGVISVDKSPSMETVVDMSDGISIDAGVVSPYMISDPSRMTTELDKPRFLVTDKDIKDGHELAAMLGALVKEGQSNLVILCKGMSDSALATAAVNNQQGKFFTVAIAMPRAGNTEVFEDIAVQLGARFISDIKGDSLNDIKIADLGKAKKITTSSKETLIIGPGGKKSDVMEIIAGLRVQLDGVKGQGEREKIEKRIARLNNKVAIIKVGAPTDNEQKALKFKVEDAVHSVKSAYRNGVVCGSGLALSRIKTSSDLLNDALQAPLRQIRENMDEKAANYILGNDVAKNLVTGEIGDFMKVGVADPLDVVIAGLESAVSIASLMVTTKGLITEYEVKDEN